jgi:hypothetical protein
LKDHQDYRVNDRENHKKATENEEEPHYSRRKVAKMTRHRNEIQHGNLTSVLPILNDHRDYRSHGRGNYPFANEYEEEPHYSRRKVAKKNIKNTHDLEGYKRK